MNLKPYTLCGGGERIRAAQRRLHGGARGGALQAAGVESGVICSSSRHPPTTACEIRPRSTPRRTWGPKPKAHVLWRHHGETPYK